MDTGLLNVLHDAGDHHTPAITECADIDFDRRLEEMIDQYWAGLRVLDCLRHVTADSNSIVSDHHGADTEHIDGAHQNGVATLLRIDAGGHRTWRLRNVQPFKQRAKLLAVFRQINGFRRRALDLDSGFLER